MRNTRERSKTEEQHPKIVADGCGKGNQAQGSWLEFPAFRAHGLASNLVISEKRSDEKSVLDPELLPGAESQKRGAESLKPDD
jgi:hypothetical protein